MKREFWKEAIYFTDTVKDYPCPLCNSNLKLLRELNEEITPAGKDDLENRYPYGIDYKFSGLLKCIKPSCGHIISMVGSIEADIKNQLYDDENIFVGEEIFSNYIPKFFHPNLRMFSLNPKLSDEVKEQLNLSFANYFHDLSSSANRLRTAVEILLDDIKAPKYHITKKKKRHYFNSLHSRIKNFKKKNKTVSKLLLAIKFIGNEGSHNGGGITLEDILDGYEIIELVIKLVYGDGSQEIHNIAEEILCKKSPRSK